MRPPFPLRSGAGFAWAAASLLLLHPFAVDAACSPAECEARFDCGSRECIGNSCVTFLDDAGTPCRPAAGVCDVAETCTGHSVACPSDRERVGTCRDAVNACDAAESCDGSADDCPADAPLRPAISRVSILDRVFVSSQGTPSNARELAFEMTGADLCETQIGVPGHGVLTMGDAGFPASRISASLFYNAAASAFGDEIFSFDVNHGAAVGTLDFAAGAQTGYIEIVSPSPGAILGGHPSFAITNACLSCSFVRLQISGDLVSIAAETGDDFAGPPLDGTALITLDSFAGSFPPDGLAPGEYSFGAEGFDGQVLPLSTFDHDASGTHFTYRYGSSVLNSLDFEVPEPGASASALGAATALALCTRLRGKRRRHR